MSPGTMLLKRPSSPPASQAFARPNIACNRVRHTSLLRVGLGCAWDFRRAQLRQPRFAGPTAAAAAAGAIPARDDTPVDALKRWVQQLSSSAYDKEIWAVALPALVAMLLEPVMNAINAGLVGHLGTQQLSAVSLGSLAVSFCTFFYTFLLFLTVPEIAAAVAKKNDDEVSCIAAKSLWIAAVCGVSSAAAMYLGAEGIVAVLKPPEPAVAAYATEFIKIRSLGIPLALLGFVATGVFRGLRDTRTPLFGALVSAAVSLGGNVLLLYVLKLGVAGSAVATTVAQAVSCALLLGALLGGGRIHARDLLQPPPLAALVPTLQLGAVLGARNLISFGMVIYASALSIRMGSAYQAGFEVIRQLWLLAIQFFECLNVATQALCASYLGQEDRFTALSLLNRLLYLAMGLGAAVGAAVWALHGPLIVFFTNDPHVVTQVLSALPLVCLFFPIDAAAAIMDGSLLAAKQSNYMSAVQIMGSIVQYFVMSYLASTGNVSLFTVWAALKILIVFRVLSGVFRNYHSPKSGYTPVLAAAAPPPTTTPAAAATAAAAPVAGAKAPPAELRVAAPVAAAAAPPPPPRPAELPPPLRLPVLERGVPAGAAAAPPPPPPFEGVVQAPTRTQVAALQSIEDDMMVLACAACTAATDMKPDMLSLKQPKQPQPPTQPPVGDQEGEGQTGPRDGEDPAGGHGHDAAGDPGRPAVAVAVATAAVGTSVVSEPGGPSAAASAG